MKYLKYITIVLFGVFSSCNLINPLEDELDALDNKLNKQIEYTLSNEDFSTLTNLALYIYPDDTVNIDFINNNRYFTETVPAAQYVPLFLNNKFPNFGAGTYADISYNYSGEMPDNLQSYTKLPKYMLTSDDYQSINDDVLAAGYLYPVFGPEKHLPQILKEQIDTASAGATYMVSYMFSDVKPEIDYSSYAINPVWQSNFDDESLFTLIDKQGNQQWKFIGIDEGSASIEGWDGTKNNPNEDWLITQTINLGGVSNTHLSLRHGIEYNEGNTLSIQISENFDGENVDDATWVEITPFPEVEGSNKNNYIDTDVIDISSFDGKKIHIAFKYVSTASAAPYWGIGNIKVGSYGFKVDGKTPYAVRDFYDFDGSDWTKNNSIHYINQSDYYGMGFSSDISAFTPDFPASDYLPNYAGIKYPMKKTEGGQIIFLYDYVDSQKQTHTLADQLTYKQGSWKSSYDFIRQITEPYAATENGWVFDPTVNFTMTSDDYGLIAAYVKNDPVLSELDRNTYADSEYYYGASAYYANFDTRGGNFYDGFASWEEAITEAIGSVLLPAKYPDAQTQYKGIDMFYLVHFVAYGAPASNYYIKFQCTKSAPNPEFTLVEGPVAE